MTDPAPSADDTAKPSLTIHPVRPDGMDAFLAQAEATTQAFVRESGFSANAHALTLLPSSDGVAGALLGLGDDRSPWVFGDLAERLPSRYRWRLAPGDYDPQLAALGLHLGRYRFTRFKPPKTPLARIDDPPPPLEAAAVAMARDLVNTPANLLGPAELADAAIDLAHRFGARHDRVTGPSLERDYPTVAAVGAGSARAPHVVRLSWGDDPDLPLISICGKGVCFDTGGYDLKPGSAMLRMKKDMGGAAIALGVAQLVMAKALPVRLELRLGCVENSVSGAAMRPLDVLTTRSGLTVEVGNTDAEGRLVLADLLAEAGQARPDWLIDFATLTGAARVALGTDLPALFSNDDDLARHIETCGTARFDPLWRLPLWPGYAPMIESDIADVNNVGQSPYGGAIVAALFLSRFVPDKISWAHIDTYAWNDKARPGRPAGGEAQGLRAVAAAIEERSILRRHKF